MEELLAPGTRTCAGCGAATAIRMVLRAIQKDVGKNFIVCNATGCMEVATTPYPETSWRIPWIHIAFENVSAVASGVNAACEYINENMNENNKTDKPKIIAIGGDGSTFDIGFGSLSGMLERNDDVLYICYDNEAYMNCLTEDALIMTEEGLHNITKIKKGDKIYSFDQNTHKMVLKECLGVYNNGKKQVFSVETLHHTLKATSNHPFLVVQHNGKGKTSTLIWKTVEHIKAGDEVIVLKKFDGRKSFEFSKIDLINKGDYKVNKLNDINIPNKSNPYIMEYLGIYLGDGCVRKDRGEVGFSLPDPEERKTLLQLHNKIFRSKFSENENEVTIFSVNLAKFINSLGFGNGAKNKTIPDWVFTLPLDEKEAFINGLLLSDGYQVKDSRSKRYVSASFLLLERLRLLLQTIDYRVGKIHTQEKKAGTMVVKRKLLKDSKYGYLCFSELRDWNVEKYSSQYKYQNFLINNECFGVEKVKNVNYLGVEMTYDLQVDESHNFIANGYVVHNTGVQQSGATPKFASTSTTPSGKVIPGNLQRKKNLVEIAAAHNVYAASTTIYNFRDLENKVRKALKIKGAKYIQIFASCPTGWRIPEKDAIKITKLAIETGIYKVFEIENGKFNLNYKPAKRKKVEEYLKVQGRFKHLTQQQIDEIQDGIDKEWQELEKVNVSAVTI
ncbi:MAG: hypothetical protein BWK75_06030 [Candidatus Altiarchaeales archaeon A3]|nr:MAG: hypothetical protein BWK75_06030 [Candidatus Altiarchaeales archaeon A3]